MVTQSGILTVTFSRLEILLPCFRQGDKWVCVHSGYQHKSNYFVLAIQSGLPFLLFLGHVIKSESASGILACAFSPFHTMFIIKKSTISESSDGCVIWDSCTVQECTVKPFFFSAVVLVSNSYFVFAVPHSCDYLYKENKLAWQRRTFYFSTDGQMIWW